MPLRPECLFCMEPLDETMHEIPFAGKERVHRDCYAENLYRYPNRDRACRICQRLGAKRHYHRKKESFDATTA